MSFLLRKQDGLSLDFFKKRKKPEDRRKKKEILSVDFPQGRSVSPVRLFLCFPFGDKISQNHRLSRWLE